MSDAQQNSLYKIASPGIANDGKTVTYKQPAWTQYKVGRQVLDSTPYANATFKIIQVGTRTREGDQWVQVQATDNQYSQANGWILYSGLTLTQTPVADNAIRINLVDSSNNNNVVKSFDYTKTGAQKGTRLGTQNGANWTLAASDQTQLQNQINTNLSGTGYYVGALNQTQINALGAATFGGSVNIAVTKQTAIADNAVRINLVTPNGTFLRSVDYPKANATKGNYLGYWNGNVWALSNDDITNINGIVNNALTGTGYFLTNGQLTSAQQQAIAAGRFGDNVTITVTSTQQSQSSQITPYATSSFWDWSPSVLAKQLTASNSQNVTNTVSLNGISYDADALQSVYNNRTSNNQDQQKAWNDLQTWLLANQGQITTANTAFKNDALTKYMAPSNMSYGPGTGQFSDTQLLAYVKENNSLVTLKSPQYPVITVTNNIVSISFNNTITYTAKGAESGTYGNAAKVYYTYPS